MHGLAFVITNTHLQNILIWTPKKSACSTAHWSICVSYSGREAQSSRGGQCVILIKNNHVYLSEELCWLFHKGPTTGPCRQTETERRTNISIWLHTYMHGRTSRRTQIKAAHMKEGCLMAGEWGPTGLPSGRSVPTGPLWPLCFVIMSPGEIIKLQGWFVFL